MGGPPMVLFGATGLLGRAWRETLARGCDPFAAPSRTEADVTSRADLETWIRPGTGVVVNCTGFNHVDAAEGDSKSAMELNVTSVGRLARRCLEVGATLVQYSSDYVFPGTARVAYYADEMPNPINAYGRSKAAGEAALRDSGCDFLLIRTSWLYAP